MMATSATSPFAEEMLRVLTAWGMSGKPQQPAETEQPDQSGGDEVARFVAEQLAIERTRRDAINTRGLSLITTSSALATLLFAGAALVTGTDKYVPPRGALWALGGALVGFVAAASCGLLSTRTFRAEVVEPEQLDMWRVRDDVWTNTKSNVSRLLTKANVRSLTSLRAGNNRKMQWAVYGFWGQLLALASLTVAVAVIMTAALAPDRHGWLQLLTPP
jgi:hypothetical protein